MPRSRPEPLSEYFAANVRRAREQLGMSQEDLAEAALKGDVRRLQRLEAGEYDVRVSTVAALAHHLGVQGSALLAPAKVVARGPGRPPR
ncbi:MAG TPA: helix-turn-helix transcriptional regulator [Pirellulales bacterium]|nr:helix-turn-helix transcriptional regulator [Pirellulales bacterium]